ncbi:MAG TPA: hypothetical protein VFZ89_14450, partial [Solirubrobacteraceae bacterium]
SRIAAGTFGAARGNKRTRAALRSHIRALENLVSSASAGSLPKVLDVVRDGFVADVRRGLRIARGQLRAVLKRDLQAFFAQTAGTDPAARAARVELALDRLDISC